MAGLKQYEQKRDFRTTPEPHGDDNTASDRLFVVQKHDASRLHYDFRLRLGDALLSWAVPKGPSLDPSDKRLAVKVEDHPVSYGGFEGVIPKGEYGGGTVMLWDRGEWAPDDDDPKKALDKGKLSFTLNGEKLRGGWTLTRMRSRKADDADNWLLIKRDDEHAERSGASILESHSRSVATDRTLEQIAQDESESSAGTSDVNANGRSKSRTSGSSKSSSKRRASKGGTPDPADIDGASKAKLPRTPSPQLCTLVDKAPEGDDWIHEIKFDGYRLLVRRDGDDVTLLTRNGKDWTDRFKPVADAVRELPAEQFILDGEVSILDDSGHTSFQRLQNAIKTSQYDDLVFYAFDLLYLDGYDLRSATLLDRKAALQHLIPEQDAGFLRYGDHVRGAGPEVYDNACKLKLEGVICKRAKDPYRERRTKSWVKVKCCNRQEFLVIGYTEPSGSRKHFGSLLLGAHDRSGDLVYTGKVGAGFTDSMLESLAGKLRSIERKTCPTADQPPASDTRGATYVTPKLVVEVQFTEWTDDRRLRHPSFQGLRNDKPPERVRIETPDELTPSEKRVSAAAKPVAADNGSKQTADRPTVAGVAVSNPDRVIFPDADVTKVELARYYESVADHMLPHLKGRPLSVVRCPQGRQRKCFFQKHLADTFSDPVRSICVQEKSDTRDYLAVDSTEGLVSLAQFGVIEIHPWGSTDRDLERPDSLTFDLDPHERVGWPDVLDAARLIRDVLHEIGLTSFAKLSGGKGVHVVVPLKPVAGWDDAKAFCKGVADHIVQQDSERFIATASKAKRAGKVFIDYLRNARGSTSVAPFSARAKPGAPVALPVRWDELASIDSPSRYDIRNVSRRLAHQRSDPWDGYFDTNQRLTERRVENAAS